MILENATEGNISLVIQRFESMTEFYRKTENARHQIGMKHSFFGHAEPKDAARYCEHGLDESHLQPARELLDKIDSSFRDRERVSWQPSPHGAYAVVPEFLANEPFNMRQKSKETNDKAPIRFYVECGVSAGVKLGQLERRAAGLAALIMRSVEERPVELYAFSAWMDDRSESYGVIPIVPIQTHPIDLLGTIAAFATREFCRTLMFANAETTARRSFGGFPWLFGYPPRERDRREQKLRKHIGCEPADVVMQGGTLHDASSFDADPVAWVHTQLEKQRTVID